MKQINHRVLKTPRVKLQILQVFFLATIIPILIFGIFSVVHVRNQMEEHYESQVRADGLRVNSILFDITTSIFTSTESITNNKKFTSLLGSEYSNMLICKIIMI